ncbi:SCP-like extracellular [Roseivivax marinus]|uniref:SCP-like extracellular n=1 Tax=Roseivivax marinus TaxID=1379903 RepID=W4HIT0_9RHOB|nr:CAP domain-containing protein [Roseivivax marinus]ETW12652.1 SCP-like extracellular [Roseivivax marinus]
MLCRLRHAFAALLCLLPLWAEAAQPLDAFRRQNGLGPLRANPALERLALGHGDYLMRSGRTTHRGPRGERVSDRARARGYRYCYIGEALARGQGDIHSVIGDWAASPSHRRILLARMATEYGLARMPGDVWVLVTAQPGC